MIPPVLDLDVIDAHHHLCHRSAASHPWLEGPRVVRYHGDDFPLRRDYLIDDYRTDTAELDALGRRLVGSVHVENGAADPLGESRRIDSVIAENSIPSVQVVKVDLTSPTAHQQLEAHAELVSVRGVRDILNWHPDPVLTHRDRGGLMTDPAWLAGFAALREFEFSSDLQVFPGQLRQAAALAADHGDIPLVLDHAGMPIERDPDALDTIDVFGPSRSMFASNFPVDGLYSTLGALFAAFDGITAGLGHGERADLFAGTARRFYRIVNRTPTPSTAQEHP